jgi:hypothetical protein
MKRKAKVQGGRPLDRLSASDRLLVQAPTVQPFEPTLTPTGTATATTQAPADFAEAVAEVDSKPTQAWSSAVHDDIENERVGAEIAAQPWKW